MNNPQDKAIVAALDALEQAESALHTAKCIEDHNQDYYQSAQSKCFAAKVKLKKYIDDRNINCVLGLDQPAIALLSNIDREPVEQAAPDSKPEVEQIAAWLDTSEGKQAIADSLARSKESCDELNKARCIPADSSFLSDEKFHATRLRRLVNMVGLADAVPESDADLLGAMGTVLLAVMHKIEELQASPPPAPSMPEVVAWPNGCDRTVPRALRHLADHERPTGGEQDYNSEHLFQLADEIESMTKIPLTRCDTPPKELEQGRDDVIEMCAQICDGVNAIYCSETIRKLKGSSNGK